MTYTLQVVTPNPTPCVTLADVKAHLRITDTAEDTLLYSYRDAAITEFEDATGRPTGPTTYDLFVSDWPLWHDYPASITIPRGGVTSVATVKYYDANNTLQTLTGWESDLTGSVGIVYLSSGSWPAISTTKPRPIVVRFSANWTVPADVLVALKARAGDLYRYRETSTTDSLKPSAVAWDRVIGKYRMIGGF